MSRLPSTVYDHVATLRIMRFIHDHETLTILLDFSTASHDSMPQGVLPVLLKSHDVRAI
jgi:hypothetical protein